MCGGGEGYWKRGGRNATSGVEGNHKTLALGEALEMIMQFFILFLLEEEA